MNAQNYTQKSLQAIQAAQQLTIQNQNQQIEQVHLLSALLQQDGGLVPQLLKKMGISVESLDAAVTAEVNKLPRVTGSGREADRFYVSRQVDEALTKSEELAKGMKDDFVSVEHLLLGQRQVRIAFQKILRDLRLGKALAYRVVRVCDVNVELRKVALCQSFPDRHGVQKRAVHVENCTFEILHWFCSFRERIS